MKFFVGFCFLLSSVCCAEISCEQYTPKIEAIIQEEPQIQFKTAYDSNLVKTLLREGSLSEHSIQQAVQKLKKSPQTLESIKAYLSTQNICVFATFKLASALLHESNVNKEALKDLKKFLKTVNLTPNYVHTSQAYKLLEKYECQNGSSSVCAEISQTTEAIQKQLQVKREQEAPLTDKLLAQDAAEKSLDPKEVETFYKLLLEEIQYSQTQIRKYKSFTKKIH